MIFDSSRPIRHLQATLPYHQHFHPSCCFLRESFALMANVDVRDMEIPMAAETQAAEHPEEGNVMKAQSVCDPNKMGRIRLIRLFQ